MKNLLLVLPMFIMAASFTFSQGDSIVQATILTEAEIQADVKYNEGVALLHSKNYSEAVNAFSEAITLKNPFSLPNPVVAARLPLVVQLKYLVSHERTSFNTSDLGSYPANKINLGLSQRKR